MQLTVTDRKSLVRAYYDVTAPVYDQKHGVSGAGQAFNFQRYYEPFLQFAIPAGSRVLEIGCGTGAYTQWLVDRGCDVTALDISSEMVEITRRRCPQATVVQGDCESPSEYIGNEKSSSHFDVVVGVNSFSYYPNKLLALRSYHSLLRPGGRMALIDMNGACPLYRAMKWIRKNEMPQWFSEIREMRESHMRDRLRQTGFFPCRLVHFCFVPNGVGRFACALLQPVDRVLSSLPGFSRLAMRMALVAERA